MNVRVEVLPKHKIKAAGLGFREDSNPSYDMSDPKSECGCRFRCGEPSNCGS